MYRLDNLNEAIKRTFANRFLKWGILLDHAVINSQSVYVIQQEDWQIKFIESNDDKGGYLEFYTSSKKYGDTHFRIYESGELMELEALKENYLYDENIPGSKEASHEVYVSENKKIYEYLKSVGLY